MRVITSLKDYQLPRFRPTPPPFPPPPCPARGSVGRLMSPKPIRPPSPKDIPRPSLASTSSRPSSSSSIRPSASARASTEVAAYERFLTHYQGTHEAAAEAGVDLHIDADLPSLEEVACKTEVTHDTAGEATQSPLDDEAHEEEYEATSTRARSGPVQLRVAPGKAPWASGGKGKLSGGKGNMSEGQDKGGKGQRKGGKGQGKGGDGEASDRRGGRILRRADGGLRFG